MCIKRFITLAVLLCLTTPILQAQAFGKAAGKLGKKAYHEQVRANSPVTHGTLSHYGGIHGALTGIDYSLAPKRPSVAETTTAPTRKRSWAAQTARNWKAWNLRRQRRQVERRTLQAEIERQALEQAKAALPSLQHEESFVVTDLEQFIPVPKQQPKPSVPFVAEPGDIAFRGLALASDGAAIRNILTNGLRLKDVGEENSTLRIAYASPGGYYAIKFFIENPVINVTYSPKSAVYWGARRLGPDLPMLMIIKIRGKFVGDSMEVVVEDIPASDIEEVITRLNINGKLTWCKVKLNEDNTFTLTPYERIFP